MPQARYVAIVDNDPAVRKGLATLLRAPWDQCPVVRFGSGFSWGLGLRSTWLPDYGCAHAWDDWAGLAGRTRAPWSPHPNKSRALGAVAYLPKPVEIDTLIAAINSSLGMS